MTRIRALFPSRRLILAGAALLCSSWCMAQAWPAKPVRLVVPYPVGTANEVFARVVAQKLSETWGQPVLVDVITGAGGVVGTQALAKAPNDGYTLGWVSSPHAINPALYKSLPFDTLKDFRPIANLVSTPLVIVAGRSFKPDTLPELLALARAEPGRINYGSNGNGSASHLATELLASLAGVRFTHVPYKSTGQMTTDLASGQLQFASLGVVTSQSLLQSGRLKALAVTSATRASLMPQLPAAAETVPGYEAKAWMGLIAPAGVPEAVVTRVQADAQAAVRDPGVQKTMAAQGLELDVLNAPEFGRRIENDMRTWARVVRDSHVMID